MTHRFGIVMVLAAALTMSGCSRNPDNAVLARVNGVKITTGEFRSRIERLPADRQQAIAVDARARGELLEEIVRAEVLAQEALRLKLDSTPEHKKQQEQMRRDLEYRYREGLRAALVNSLLQKVLPAKVAPPTDDEVRNYFQAHRDEIRKMTGKDLTYQEALDRGLRNHVFQMRQQGNVLDYTKGLREKASVQVETAALDSFGKPSPAAPAVPATKPPAK